MIRIQFCFATLAYNADLAWLYCCCASRHEAFWKLCMAPTNVSHVCIQHLPSGRQHGKLWSLWARCLHTGWCWKGCCHTSLQSCVSSLWPMCWANQPGFAWVLHSVNTNEILAPYYCQTLLELSSSKLFQQQAANALPLVQCCWKLPICPSLNTRPKTCPL